MKIVNIRKVLLLAVFLLSFFLSNGQSKIQRVVITYIDTTTFIWQDNQKNSVRIGDPDVHWIYGYKVNNVLLDNRRRRLKNIIILSWQPFRNK